jgi:hypothetical protein
MKRAFVFLSVTAGFCGAPAFALDLDPAVRTKAISAAAPASAPATNPSRVQLPDLQGGLDEDGRSFSGACSAAKSSVCYDYREGRIVVKSTKNFMPAIGGLTPEHISVRRDRITFRYSFK